MKAKFLIPMLTLTCLLATPALAQVNYAVSGGSAYVTRSPYASGYIFIASTYQGKPVTSIEGRAFSDCTRLTSVTIPNSVTNIGFEAFSDCTSLMTVTIPNSVTSIGDYSFQRCTSLTTVTIPNSVTYIGAWAFLGCSSLTNFSVDAANAVYSSLDGVWFNKAQTTLIQFPAGRGGGYAIPNSVTSIEFRAFYGCTSLTSVTIPNSVTSIGAEAFIYCTSLTSVTIPNSVNSIGNDAFYYCTSLTNFSVDAANAVYGSLDGVWFNKAQTTLIQFPAGRGGGYAIPNTVTNIGDSSFYYCTSLTSVAIPNSVTSIGWGAFWNCISLTTVTIPNSVTDIGWYAFYYCTSLTIFSVDAANAVYSSLDGVWFNKAQTTLIQFPAGRGGAYAIPNSVTDIGWDAFAFCTSLTTVTIPNSVISIEDYSFSDCTNLTSITFLGNVPSEGAYIFDNVAPGAKVYYYYGTTGWGPTHGGLPTVMLGAPAPQVAAASAGVKPGGFGFTLNGVINQTIVVEASTNLVKWQPIWTNTLSAASAAFVDPQWLSYPRRFYRVESH